LLEREEIHLLPYLLLFFFILTLLVADVEAHDVGVGKGLAALDNGIGTLI